MFVYLSNIWQEHEDRMKNQILYIYYFINLCFVEAIKKEGRLSLKHRTGSPANAAEGCYTICFICKEQFLIVKERLPKLGSLSFTKAKVRGDYL